MTTKLLIVEDDAGLREALLDTLEVAGYECLEAPSGEAALLHLQEQAVDMVISDIQMGGMNGLSLLKNIKNRWPQLPVLLMTAYAQIDDAVEAMREGAIDYLSKPFAPEVLLNQVSRYAPVKQVQSGEPVAADAQSLEMLALAARVATSDASVMITGPSGTGKEVLARYLHDKSARAEEPFVAINCAAIPENMLEATLFGYEKGAYTGAVQACPGKFEQAQGGTILLDEITEMDLGLQAKLLRVLQEREVERLGGRKTIALNIRVLATSNRDMKQAVKEGIFREDLYYRLNVFPLRWLALKDRPDDILPLATMMIQRHSKQLNLPSLEMSEQAQQRLVTYSWPGNVRELENVMQRALILAQNGEIQASDLVLDEEFSSASSSTEASVAPINELAKESVGNELKQHEHQIILKALQACNGKRQAVAEKLGISPRTLRYKMAKMRDAGIEVPA